MTVFRLAVTHMNFLAFTTSPVQELQGPTMQQSQWKILVLAQSGKNCKENVKSFKEINRKAKDNSPEGSNFMKKQSALNQFHKLKD